jgi:hypothetical protein
MGKPGEPGWVRFKVTHRITRRHSHRPPGFAATRGGAGGGERSRPFYMVGCEMVDMGRELAGSDTRDSADFWHPYFTQVRSSPAH